MLKGLGSEAAIQLPKSSMVPEHAVAQLHRTHDMLSCFRPPIPETPGLLAHDRNTPLYSLQLSPNVALPIGSSTIFQILWH